MATTLRDIAKRAGVSATTVSLVLNQGSQSRISESTREKVLQVVKELGYQTNKSLPPTSLVVPPSIGLVFTDVTNPFFTAMAAVIEDVASRYGYNIILCNTQRSLKKEKEYLDVLGRRRIDGLIIAPVDDDSSAEELARQNIPVVFIDRHPPDIEHVNAVLLENIEAARMAVEYLLQLGHRRIGIITGRSNISTGKERLDGYLQALSAYQIAIDDHLICDGQFTVEGGQEAASAMFNLAEPPSAIFSCGGVMSIGAMLEIKARNLRIPQNVSFIGIDDEKWCQLVDPPLTVVAQPVTEIATEAAQMLIQLIQGWGTQEARRILLKPQLIARQSCAKPSINA